MIIKSIKMENFISHQETEFPFPVGVLVIVGENGSGKSSIIDAIFYSLCGVQVRGDTVDDLIREGTKKARVNLLFEHNGIAYEIERVREKDVNPYALLKKNGSVVARKQTPVSEEITRILGMDKEVIINSVFIRQGEITKLIDGTPSERKKTIAKLIGIEKLEKCYDKMRNVIDYFDKQLNDFDIINTKLQGEQESKTELDSEIEEITREIKNIKEDIVVAEDTFKKAEDEKTLWENKRKKHQELKNKKIKKEEQILSTTEKINNLTTQVNDAKKAREKVAELEPQIRNIEILERYIDNLRNKTHINETLERLHKEFEKVDQWLTILNTNKDKVKEFNEINESLSQKEDEIENLRKVEKEFIELKKDIESTQRKLTEYKGEIENIEVKTLKILPKAEKKEKDKKIRELNSKIKDLEENLSNLISVNGAIEGRIKEIDNYLLKFRDSDECPVCSSELTPSHKQKVIKDFNKEKSGKTKEIEENMENVSSLGKMQDQFREHLDNVKSLDLDKYDELKEKYENSEVQLKEFEMKRQEKGRAIEKLKLLEDESKKEKKRVEELKPRYNDYIAAEKALKNERNIKEIQNKINEFNTNLNNIKEVDSKLTNQLKKIPEKPEEELIQLRKLKEEYIVAKGDSQKLEKFEKDLINTEKILNDFISKSKKLDSEINSLGYDEELYEQVQKKNSEASSTLEKLKNSENLKTVELDKKTQKLIELKQKISELLKQMESFEQIRNFKKILGKIRDAFSKDGLQKTIRKIFAPKITDFAKEYLESFNINVSDISINEDLDISILGRSGVLSINSISGGEKVAVAIILRLAIASILSSQISTIIMDEPTTHLDSQRRKELVEAMKSFKKESHTIPQLIIVTHHKELEELADTLFKVDIKDGVSKVEELTYI